jgi:hypothetical protein
MTTETIVQIVPSLPPQLEGVGEYAMNLALRLRKSQGIETQFIVCDPAWTGPHRMEGFVVRRLKFQSEAGIWSLLASAKEKHAIVLLHYIGHGYHRHGIPLWLYRGLGSWLAEGAGGTSASQKQLATVFHELWKPSIKPWKKEFYLQKPQQWLVEGLHLRSNFSVATTKHKQAMLEGIQPDKTFWLSIPKDGLRKKEAKAARATKATRADKTTQDFDSRWRLILTDLITGAADNSRAATIYKSI